MDFELDLRNDVDVGFAILPVCTAAAILVNTDLLLIEESKHASTAANLYMSSPYTS
jgi:hypothetical protein